MLAWFAQKYRAFQCLLLGHWYDNTSKSIFDAPKHCRFHCLYCGERQPGTETYT